MIDPGFTTEAMSSLFSASRRVEAMLRFEAALALALADAGIAPMEEAEAVARACDRAEPAPEAILAAAWTEGTPVIPLLESVRPHLDGDQARWLHAGATTQDVVDTAAMLLADEALGVLDSRICQLARHLARLAGEHGDLPQIGRTFLQHALPTTFGMRVAGWLESTLDHLDALRQARSRLTVQLGGPVGSLGAFENRAVEVVKALARRLSLEPPALPWHTDRSRVADLVSRLERCARTMARIGVDVAMLASTDIGEIGVRTGGSSSIPGKENPIDAVRAVAAAEVCSGAASMVTSGRPNELDRGIGGWQVEWLAVPLVFGATAAAVEAMVTCVGSMRVDADRMAANLGDREAVSPDHRLIERVVARFHEMVGPA